MVIHIDNDEQEPLDDSPPEDDPAERLNGLRVRQISALRRSTFRARSQAIVGVIVSPVAAVVLVLITIDHVRRMGWGLLPVGYLAAAAGMLVLASRCGRRVRELQREIRESMPVRSAPEVEPDFSTLSDGSQQWKNLEDIR